MCDKCTNKIEEMEHDLVIGQDITIGAARKEAYTHIIEWLYSNDGTFDDKHEWRKAFISLLQKELL